ncbi:hypothetical protein KCH_73790 [Kitasatospora cheerisanensis KCTC 2395]|uniref:Uncharacterized protein n=1 Tax=Kitasatospora cheerisanensis KCTC 2395 TaxID=1348663 RepID=A0A066YLT9_9ACTN|nr:hypothetical protein KCH_73790 [Kitasatospora cheerisanensis KCTC 2395]
MRAIRAQPIAHDAVAEVPVRRKVPQPVRPAESGRAVLSAAEKPAGAAAFLGLGRGRPASGLHQVGTPP